MSRHIKHQDREAAAARHERFARGIDGTRCLSAKECRAIATDSHVESEPSQAECDAFEVSLREAWIPEDEKRELEAMGDCLINDLDDSPRRRGR